MDYIHISDDQISVGSDTNEQNTKIPNVLNSSTSTTSGYLTCGDDDSDTNDNFEDCMQSVIEVKPTFHSKSIKKEGTGGDRKHSYERRTKKIYVSYERLRSLKQKVDQAIKDHKVFSVYGQFPSVREALKQRGWVEKVVCYNNRVNDDSVNQAIQDSLQRKTSMHALESEAMLMTRLLRNTSADFIWCLRFNPLEMVDANKTQIVSKIPRPNFTSKVGLCSFLQQMQWFSEEGISDTLFPRCYNICDGEEKIAFRNDFRLTGCISLLKWLVNKYESGREAAVQARDGRVPLSAIQFALKRCSEYISSRSHEDIDKNDPLIIWDHQWDQFLTWYYMLVEDKTLLTSDKDISVKNLYATTKTVLVKLKKFWPQIDIDGIYNIWILKPGYKCRGRGIQLVNRLETIWNKINPTVMKESRYVVQKYIECPLLIYKTKFDIRQWFVVTSTNPLVIWMYKESYLRFCSQPFSLKNFHESVHLCNNAVQVKYKNGKRDPALPNNNMWDCYTFQAYLRTIGHADKWEKCIYPGMKASIIGTLLAAQEHMDKRKYSFELFGADFMVAEDFSPWLIEINSCPCMAPTTNVTARMCSQCLEDVVKVVIDSRQKRNANTGLFECIYKQRVVPAPPYLGTTLAVRGNKCNLKSSKTNLNMRTRKSEMIRKTISTEKPKQSKQKQSVVVVPEKVSRKPIKTNPADILGPVVIDFIEDLAHQISKEACLGSMEVSKNKGQIANNKIYVPNAFIDVTRSKEQAPLTVNLAQKEVKLGNVKIKKINGVQKKSEINMDKELVNENQKTQESNAGDAASINLNKAAYHSYFGLTAASLIKGKAGKGTDWKNSADAMKSMEIFSGWRKKLDETKNSCESMLARLKLTGEIGTVTKPNIFSLNKTTKMDGDLPFKRTVDDIIKQLPLKPTDKELKKTQEALETGTSKETKQPMIRDESKVKHCYLKVLSDNDNITRFKRQHEMLSPQYLAQKLPFSPEAYKNALEKSSMFSFKGILPHIKQANKQYDANDNENDRRLDNFYAVGLGLKAV